MENETFLQKLSEFPKVFAYGIEQAVNKLLLDRFHRMPFKYRAMVFPRSILRVRRFILKSKQTAARITRREPNPKRQSNQADQVSVKANEASLPVIRMSSMIAAMGRSQLKKVDRLNLRRREMTRKLSQLPNTLLPSKESIEDVCTHLALHFPGRDIFRLISIFKQHGILLRATWPTHQRLWAFQDTPNVLKIKNEILTYDVSPMLTEWEVRHFIDVMETSANPADDTGLLHT